MLRKVKESQEVKGYVIESNCNGYALVRYHSDYGVYTNETVLEGIRCHLFPDDKNFKKVLEAEMRKKYNGVLPKTLYIEEAIFEDNFLDDEDEEDEEFYEGVENGTFPGDDGYDEGEEDFYDYVEKLMDSD